MIINFKDVQSWPWILVATKCDCEQERQVTSSEAMDLAVKLVRIFQEFSFIL